MKTKNKIKRTRYKAVIFNDGIPIKTITIGKKDTHFKFKNKLFKIDFEKGTYIKVKKLMKNEYYFLYQLDNPSPLRINNFNITENTIDSDTYYTMIYTKVTKDLNNLTWGGFQLKKEYIIGGLILLGIIIYFGSGGTLT